MAARSCWFAVGWRPVWNGPVECAEMKLADHDGKIDASGSLNPSTARWYRLKLNTSHDRAARGWRGHSPRRTGTQDTGCSAQSVHLFTAVRKYACAVRAVNALRSASRVAGPARGCVEQRVP